MSGDAAPQRLADAIEARKRQLRLQWTEIAEGAGITDAQLRKFRNGTTGIRKSTQDGLERMLGWKPGAFDRIRAGLDPESLDDSGAAAEAKAAVDRNDDPGGSRLHLTNFGAAIFQYPPRASEEERQKILRRIEEEAAKIAAEYGAG